MSQGELVQLYAYTFNSPVRSRFVYDKMMTKYDDFFEKELKKASASFELMVQGKQFHQIVMVIIEFYDNHNSNKRKIVFQMLSEEDKENYKNLKKQTYQFIDALIDTLNKEFGEEKVTIKSSR